MPRKSQIFNNAVYNSASWVFTIVVSFIFVPYIVRKLGTDSYGVLVLVLSVIGYFAVLDLNLGDAVIKYVAEYHAENDTKKVNEVIGNVILLYLILGIIGGVAIFATSGPIVTRLLHIKSDLQPVAQFAFNIGSVGILLTMMLSAMSAIPNGINRYDITSKGTMAMGLITTVVTVLLLYLGKGLKEIVLMNVGMTLVGIIFYAVVSKRLVPGLVLRPSLSTSGLKKVLKFGLFSMLSRLSAIMQFQGVRLLSGAVLGVSSVTYYVVPFNLVSKAMAITFRLGVVIFPVISSMQGKKDFDSVTSLYLKSSRLIFTISTAICLPLFLFGDRFLGLWMGQAFKTHTGIVMLVLTLSLYLDACTNVPSNVLNGLGSPKICGYFSILNAVINLALVYPLSKWLNINGVALSFLLGHMIVAPLFVVYVNNVVLKLSIGKLLREAYLMPSVAGLFTVFILKMAVVPESVGRLSILLGVMMGTTTVYLILSTVMGVFSKNEIEHMVSYLRLGRKAAAKDSV